MVTQVRIEGDKLTFVSHSLRGEHTRENLLNVHNRASKGRKVRAQLKKEVLEVVMANKCFDNSAMRKNARAIHKAAKKAAKQTVVLLRPTGLQY